MFCFTPYSFILSAKGHEVNIFMYVTSTSLINSFLYLSILICKLVLENHVISMYYIFVQLGFYFTNFYQ